MLEKRVPPQNIEAEQAVLGAMLIDKEAIIQVSEILTNIDFYREAHRVIFEAMLELYNKHEAVDMVTVTEILKRDNKLEGIGGLAYITSLANVVVTAANVKYHADIVAEKSVLRQLVRVATEIAARGYEANEDVGTLLDTAERRILEISNRNKKTDFTPINEVLMKTVQNIEKLINNKGGLTGLPSGFTDLDKLTSGLNPSDFIILAARPSMGKTALALNIVQNVALRAHKKIGGELRSVAFFSLEMNEGELVKRMICSEAGIDSQRLRMGEMSDKDWEALWGACDVISKAKIYIDDTSFITVMEMRSRARRLQAEHGLDLIVVDYLQLMQGSSKISHSDNRQQEVSEISRSLKALVRELNVPVLALSQLSRSVEQRAVQRPMLSDLRESGSLEQDADIVAFLYREDYYKPDTENKHTELIIAKHRNGPVDTVNLFFDKKCTKFVGLSKRDEAC